MHNKSKKRDAKKLNRVFSHPLCLRYRDNKMEKVKEMLKNVKKCIIVVRD